MASLLITLGDAEAAVLAKAYFMGRPGYLRSVDALLETAADVAQDANGTSPAAMLAARNTLAAIADDVHMTIKQAMLYVAKREASK